MRILAISDYPIVLSAMRQMLEEGQTCETVRWGDLAAAQLRDLDLLIVDVTSMPRHEAFSRLRTAEPGVQIALFSLHANEVEVYIAGANGPSRHCTLPCLLLKSLQAATPGRG